MKPLKTVRLALHPGRTSVSWSLIHRTDDGRTIFDRRLHAGTVADIGLLAGIADVPTALRHIADEIERRHGIPSPEAAREPRGAVGGGTQDHRPGRVCAADCSLCGQHLDGMPSDD